MIKYLFLNADNSNTPPDPGDDPGTGCVGAHCDVRTIIHVGTNIDPTVSGKGVSLDVGGLIIDYPLAIGVNDASSTTGGAGDWDDIVWEDNADGTWEMYALLSNVADKADFANGDDFTLTDQAHGPATVTYSGIVRDPSGHEYNVSPNSLYPYGQGGFAKGVAGYRVRDSKGGPYPVYTEDGYDWTGGFGILYEVDSLTPWSSKTYPLTVTDQFGFSWTVHATGTVDSRRCLSITPNSYPARARPGLDFTHGVDTVASDSEDHRVGETYHLEDSDLWAWAFIV